MARQKPRKCGHPLKRPIMSPDGVVRGYVAKGNVYIYAPAREAEVLPLRARKDGAVR